MLWRVHGSRFGAVHFGRGARGRFDAPAGEFGVLYVGATGAQSALETRHLSTLSIAHELRFLQFEGRGLAHLGIGADRAHAEPYAECQQLALALWRAHPEIDGLQYRSRWDTSTLCWAIFDRAAHKLGPVRSAQRLGDVAVWAPLLDPYGVEVL